ncbi:MAG: GTP-binding protein [Acidobacteria bacterium]|nr:GTP-binding protein [Acidobacteriota bacterium]
MQEVKILFTGSMGAGKTAAISALSEAPTLRTEAPCSDRHRPDKLTTTVGLDYGEITIAPDCKVRLFGTPGQARYRYLWDILATGALGVLILVDHSEADSSQQLEGFLDAFADILGSTPGVVGITHADLRPERPFDAYLDVIQRRGLSIPLLQVDAREREDVLALVDAVLAMAESGLYKEAAAAGGMYS